MLDPEKIKAPFYSAETIYKKADEFRAEQANWGNVPVDIERIIEIGLGIKIQPRTNLRKIAGTDALLLGGQHGIIVVDDEEYNDPRYWPRLRFSLAHELGHFILHRNNSNLYGDIEFDTVDEWVAFLQKVPIDTHFYLEHHANQFAGRLLVPRAELVEELEKAKLLKGLGSVMPVPDEHIELLCMNIGRKFHVSAQCIQIRISREGLN